MTSASTTPSPRARKAAPGLEAELQKRKIHDGLIEDPEINKLREEVANAERAARIDKETAEWSAQQDKDDPGWRDRIIAGDPEDSSAETERLIAAFSDAYTQDLRKATERFIRACPFWLDGRGIWWCWDHERSVWTLTDEQALLSGLHAWIDRDSDATIRRATLILVGLRQVARFPIPPGPTSNRWTEPRPLPKNTIQFGKQLYHLIAQHEPGTTTRTGEYKLFDEPATPSWFCTSSIPWTVGTDNKTPTIDRLLAEWVGPTHATMLLELLAYACLNDYPIAAVFVLYGTGSNGKSKFIKLLERFLGQENVATTSLDALNTNRFETFALYHKLAAVMGETNLDTLKSTDPIKRMTGGDLIRYEKKHADVIQEKNFTKLLIASNQLPLSRDESDGFYRRWRIIDFPHHFPEGPCPVDAIPRQEFEALAHRVLEILPALLQRCRFTGEGSIEDRRAAYIRASNPVQSFIEQCCTTNDPDAYESKDSLYQAFVRFCSGQHRRAPNISRFKTALITLGYDIERTTKTVEEGEYLKGEWVYGLKLKRTLPDFTQVTQVTQHFSLNRVYKKNKVENVAQPAQLAQNSPDTLHAKEEVVR